VNFPRVSIDASALRNNLAVVRRFAPHSRVLAAVKANAYGHGLVLAVRALSAADAFGLARLEEALALRAEGITHPLVLLEGVVNGDDLRTAAAHRLEIVVHSLAQVAMLESFGGAARLTVWLKLDTGMHRLGLSPSDFREAYRRVSGCKIVENVRLMTHLAMAEAPDDPFTRSQIELFNAMTLGIAAERSIANSAGLIGWPEARVEWVRPGLMLYGISPMPDATAARLGLRPAMTLATELISLNPVKAGDTVGYGCAWRASRDSVIGVAAIGYGDGYPRHLPSGAPVLVNGREAVIAGRVSMDMIALDVTGVPGVQVGDEVVLWGAGLPIERVAQCAGTIGYELACRVNERVHRRAVTSDW
jgi:alanine racemase